MTLTAFALNCSLKPSSQASSSDRMIDILLKEFAALGISGGRERVADHDVKPGVESDMGDGDDWPALRERVLGADILILATPIWMGQTGSVAKRVLERMDAFLGETDPQGRMPSSSKVAVAAVVGNEDGAHHVTAELFQALNDVGFTQPANAAVYWVGEAMGSVDFKDLEAVPEKVAATARTLARNAAHLAALLQEKPYPGAD